MLDATYTYAVVLSRRVAVIALVLALAAVAGAQGPPPAVRSPEVHADRRVTFRLRAPNAAHVDLVGEVLQGKPSRPMTKDAHGVWSLTIGPLPPEIWIYNFRIEGVDLPDPANISQMPRAAGTAISSFVEVPGDYVEHRAKLPWFIDLLNLNIGNDDPAEAKRRIARFVDEFNSHGQRLADNMRLYERIDVMRTLLAVAVVFMCGGSAYAAEYGLDTWTAGAGSSARTFVFKMQGDRFVGVACGPCDDPSTVVRVVSGTTTRPGHVSFSIVGGNTPSTSPMTLRHVGDDRTLIATVKSEPAPKMARLDGRWVASGRNAQQNFTLKLRDGNTVWGVVCGPCDKPEGVFLLDDGTLDGDAISFFIHHVDNRRNWMRGVVTGNVMKFKWVREGHESEPGGEITMIGPVR